MQREWQQGASAPVRHAEQGFEAQFQIAFGENPLDGALLEFLGEFENGAQDRPQAVELSLQPVQFAALRVRGPFVDASGRVAPRTPRENPAVRRAA
ncbi:MAG: hypothetical protein MZV65_02490 [Chromatiales bacterium]|nr:hypothetical protein [Chromatiales bacterium]